MKPGDDRGEEQRFEALLRSIQPGNAYFVTGKNGSGKSRFFAYATREMYRAQQRMHPTGRLLCLSGTLHDKYPPPVYRANAAKWDVVYLGHKVNNNMVSGTAPFRVLCHYMLRNMGSPALWTSVARALKRLNLEPRVTFSFRLRRKDGTDVFGSLPDEVSCSLLDYQNDLGRIESYLGLLYDQKIQLADVSFFRDGVPYGLNELSSGEKQYALSILGFIYCGSPGCTVFYDEPENSLHPAWQLSIVKDLAEVADELRFKATLIIATHSPLIASSVRNGNVYLCDLPAGQAWQRADLFGRASDTVLREQFHLYSARSPEVAAVINQCLAYVAQNETGRQGFREAQAELRDFGLNLTPDDPVAEIVKTLLGL
ncbi:AAA family ATPase [Sinorhizobium meliloti]|uniref:AAA family ATPase n=1 Tax=Rhizobium meliloti TaxID=382 RepID=UPI003D655D44